MALYDRYPDVISNLPPSVQRMEQHRQRRIMACIQRHVRASATPRALEVGVGIGLFAQACAEAGWSYTGVDRNEKMLERLGETHRVVHGEVPPMPDELKSDSFDVAYSSFVVEHLADGIEALHFIEGMVDHLESKGLVVIVVPDALSLGLEFWNLDYTHRYPTMERNVEQVLLELGLEVEQIVRYRGPFITGIARQLLRVAGWAYRYHFWRALFGHKQFFYSVYQYVCQDVLMFIARKP